MRQYTFQAKRKNKNKIVTGDYLYNDKTGNHIIATEKEEYTSNDYGSAYNFWIIDVDTLEEV